MGCHHFKSKNSYIILTLADIYKYKGFIFEFHHYLGPCKLKKDFEPAKLSGRKFYKILAKWEKLTNKQKKKTQVYG